MTPILLTSHLGTLSLLPPDETVAAKLRSELSFRHTFKTMEPIQRWNPRTGMMVGGRAKPRYETRTEALYVEEDDGHLLTHDGMLRAVTDALDAAGIPHAYERLGVPWPQPVIAASIFRGLDAPQREAAVKLLLSVGGALAQAPTAFGKTRIIAALARAYPTQRILILTKAASVVRGLHRELGGMLEEDGVEMGICLGRERKDVRRVTVTTVASAHHFDPMEVDVLIADEVHTMTGDSYSSRIMAFNRAPHYGLSGSLVKRFDGKEKYLISCFGPVVYRSTDQESEERGRVCPLRVYFLNVPRGPEVERLQDAALKRHGFWRNAARNALAADVVRLAPESQQLLIFVETLEHLEWLMSNCLKDLGFEACHGEMKAEERGDIERRFTFGECKRLIATDCLSTGVDPKQLRIMIDLSGVKGDASMYQKRGRLRRWAPGKRYGVLIQFDDEWSPKLARKALARRKEYEEHGDAIVDGAAPNDVKFDVNDINKDISVSNEYTETNGKLLTEEEENFCPSAK